MTEHWDNIELDTLEPTYGLKTGTLSTIIDNYIIQNPDSEIRTYLGASSIGSPCERKLWYGYTGIPGTDTEPQMQRTFDIGKRLEGLVLDYLESAGCFLERRDAFLYFSNQEVPALQGHVDALWHQNLAIDGPRYTSIIEVKTARDSSFNVFVKKGLLEWYPVYYAQVQAYMGMSGYHEAYVIAINKDTSALHDEYVVFDEQYYKALVDKAHRIVNCTEPPPKINQNSSFFMCRNCQYNGVCHG